MVDIGDDTKIVQRRAEVTGAVRRRRWSVADLLGWHGPVPVRQEAGGRQIPLAAHRGRRDAIVGGAIGGADRGFGLDARSGAACAYARRGAVACDKVNQVRVLIWQIAGDVLCLARGPTN